MADLQAFGHGPASGLDLSLAAISLRDVHDQIVRDLGGSVYASVSATWTDENGKLRTLTYSSTENDEDEDEDG